MNSLHEQLHTVANELDIIANRAASQEDYFAQASIPPEDKDAVVQYDANSIQTAINELQNIVDKLEAQVAVTPDVQVGNSATFSLVPSVNVAMDGTGLENPSMVIGVLIFTGGISSITYNGFTATLKDSKTFSPYTLYTYLIPACGSVSANLVVTFIDSAQEGIVQAAIVNNANQSTVVGTTATNSGSATPYSVVVTGSSSKRLLLAFVGGTKGTVMTMGAAPGFTAHTTDLNFLESDAVTRLSMRMMSRHGERSVATDFTAATNSLSWAAIMSEILEFPYPVSGGAFA